MFSHEALLKVWFPIHNSGVSHPNSNYSLWDVGQKTCMCYGFNLYSWFCKALPQHTTDDIELRVCTNENDDNEHVGVGKIDMYIL